MQQLLKYIYTISVLLVTLYAFHFIIIFSYNHSSEINIHYTVFLVSLILFGGFILLIFFEKRNMHLEYWNYSIHILVLFGLLNIAIEKALLDNEYYISAVIIGMIYLAICYSSEIVIVKVIPYLISLFLLIEIGIGISQLILYRASDLPLSLNISGSFENSGIFSIYLCVAFPFLYYTITNFSIIPHKQRLIILYIVAVVIIVLICISMSRTSIILFAILSFIFIRKKIIKPTKSITFIPKPVTIGIIVLSGVTISLFLFHLKSDSALGRLFIWKVCTHHLFQNVIPGIGIGNFSSFYPAWQIDYIATKNISSNLLLNVDETHVAFNEYIQLFIELGVFRFSILSWLVVNTFRSRSSNRQDISKYAKYSFIVLLVSALFTYSFHVYILQFFFALNFFYLLYNKSEDRKSFSSTFHNISISFISIFVFVNILFTYKKQLFVSAWNKVRDDYEIKETDKISAYKALYKELQTSGKFLLDFGEQLTINKEYKEAIKVINKSKELYLSERSFYLAANADLLSNDTIDAIYNIKCLTQLVPFKLSSKAYLVKMYLNFGDTSNAICTLKEIEAMPIKVTSNQANIIKQHAKDLLEQIVY